ncbi:MAG: hypothetical protein ACREGF_02585 [Candidatus Saccharimonadales bacterium]
MDSLNDILGRKDYETPPEIAAIKQFVKRQFEADANVQIRADVIIIAVASASLAASLRLQTVALKKAAATDKKLAIRIV